MRWGLRDEAMDDHATTDLCLQEIDNCQRLSVGPNFCVSHFFPVSVTHTNNKIQKDYMEAVSVDSDCFFSQSKMRRYELTEKTSILLQVFA